MTVVAHVPTLLSGAGISNVRPITDFLEVPRSTGNPRSTTLSHSLII